MEPSSLCNWNTDMNPGEELIVKYPDLFDKDESGFDYINFYFPKGWKTIVFTLCSCINGYTKRYPGIKVTVEQIKEKFGGLRFYYSGGDDNIRGMVYLAEELSYTVCEVTGNPGKLCRSGAWFKTLSEDFIKTSKFCQDYKPVE